ncbi:glycosyltransferase [Candidatus Peregrinibacteria bacterium]|nr:glycosyltransferase [Candidatus Peregrinibacteria bacterium]
MQISIIITTYNRSEKLKDCLKSYMKQSLPKNKLEIIVVDDGSKDDTKDIVKKYKNVRYVYQKNSGQGIARNNGIDKANGEIVLFGQDDIVPSKDFVEQHLKFHLRYPEKKFAVLGFTAWHPGLKVNQYMKWMTNGSSIFGMFGGHQFAYEKLKNKTDANYNFFYTSNISLKRVLLEKYPFDPSFSGYGWEDIELGYRLYKKAGLIIKYNPNAIAYHDHEMNENDLKKRMKSIGKAAWIFHKKYPELNKIPGFMKGLIFNFIGSTPVVWFFKVIKMLNIPVLKNLYFYALSKKYFMEGVKEYAL